MNFTCIARSHGAPAVPATREAWEKMRREPWLAEMCRRIEAGEAKLKHKLPIWTPHCAQFTNNHRSIKDAEQPLSRLMLDFDEKGHSAEILEKSLRLQEEGKWCILLVEDSVRRGTHVLIELPPGMAAEEAQTRFSADVGFTADAVVKDVSRCIYLVPEGHTLYVSEELFSPQPMELPSGEGGGGVLENTQKESEVDVTHTPLSPLSRGEKNELCVSENTHADAPEILRDAQDDIQGNFPSTFEQIPYTRIVEVLEEQMGGKPEHGSRNNHIYAMACHLRYICNDDPEWIASLLPTYGEEQKKWMNSIRSACQRSQTRQMPDIIRRTLGICRKRQEENDALLVDNSELTALDSGLNEPPPMPEELPPLIRLLVSRTPQVYQPAVAHAVFPALGAHLWRTRFRYIDNVEHEATLMNVLMAGTGAGKNCISEPVNRIMADIRRRDTDNMRREKEWKNEMNTKGANKDKKKRPEGLVVQEIDPDTTNAAFVMRLAEAEERFLYTRMNEIDQFDALKTSLRSKTHFQIMCLAFDPGNLYGQTRVGTASVSDRVCIRFNWNASTTIRKGKAYFRSVLTDGPISRINFCTIPERPIGAEMPVYGTYGEDFDTELEPYIRRLTEASGLVECPEAERLARTLMEENAEFSRLSQSRVYENLSFRANVIAYLKAMVLYVAHGYVWSSAMEEFVRWSLKYDMWCKMRFFGEAIEEAECETVVSHKAVPQNLLDLLPDTFTREEAAQMRQRQGIRSGSLRLMLNNWKQRGYIVAEEDARCLPDPGRQRFRKTEKYLGRG